MHVVCSSGRMHLFCIVLWQVIKASLERGIMHKDLVDYLEDLLLPVSCCCPREWDV